MEWTHFTWNGDRSHEMDTLHYKMDTVHMNTRHMELATFILEKMISSHTLYIYEKLNEVPESEHVCMSCYE